MTSHPIPRARALILLVAGCASPEPAQPYQPPRLDPAVVRAITDTFLVTSRGEVAIDTLAWAVQTYRRVGANGSAAWEQVFEWRGANGTVAIDSLLFDAVTLRPITQRLTTGSGRKIVEYRDGRVIVREERRGLAPLVTELSFDVPAYSAAEIDVLVRALPLPMDGAVRVPLFYPGGSGLQWATIRAAGAERIRTRAGREADTWRVDVSVAGDVQRYWIATDSRAVLQVVDGTDTRGSQVAR